MRSVKSYLAPRVGTLQGLCGVALVAGGSFALWGAGVAALVLGAFLLVGAWGSA